MSLSKEQKQIAISLLIEKADRNLQQAKANAELSSPSDNSDIPDSSDSSDNKPN